MLKKKTIDVLKSMTRQSHYNAENNTDEQAVKVKELYPEFEEIKDGELLSVGNRVNYFETLYKVIQEHNKQSTWNPQEATSLFTPIDESHEGTIEDPIPWVSGMESEYGLYYTDEGIIYLCIESSGVGLYAQPKDLLRYFEIA